MKRTDAAMGETTRYRRWWETAITVLALGTGAVGPAMPADFTLETVALTGATAPGSTKPFLDFAPAPVINNPGDVAFSGTINPAFGVFRSGLYERRLGQNEVVIREGDAIAAAGGALISKFISFGFVRATINPSGAVAFRAELDVLGPGGITNDNRFILLKGSPGGDVSVVARQGDLPPGAASEIQQVDVLPSINVSGDVAFAAAFLEGSFYGNHLAVAGPSGLAFRVHPGDDAPGIGTFFALGTRPGLSDAGDIAFSAIAHSPASGLNFNAIYKSEGGILRLVIAQDDPAPGFEPTRGGPRRIQNLLADNAVSMNATGRVAFYGEATGFGDNQAIFKEGSTGVMLVARTFRPAPGAGGATFKELGARGVVGFEMLAPGLSDNGDVAFLATLQGTDVTPANDQGLWAEVNGSPLQLILRKGDALEVAPGDVRVISGLGFYRGYSRYGLAFHASFTDNSQGIFVARFATPPQAVAGGDQTVDEMAPVQLDGSASTGSGLTYAWSQLAGPAVALSDPAASNPTFSAPILDGGFGSQVLTFQLTVTSGTLSSSDTVDVTVKNVNHEPVAAAGADQVVNEGSAVMLAGDGSFDPDGDATTFSWRQTSGPAVVLAGAEGARPTFAAPLLAGGVGAAVTLTFELTVSDGTLSGSDTVQVTVEQVNHAPIADAGTDQTRNEGSSVTLDGSASRDPDGDALAYAWTQVAGPPVALSDSGNVRPFFVAPAVGPGGAVLRFRLTVSDGAAVSAPAEVAVSVRNVNDPPVCGGAHATPAILWPPNHKLVRVGITGVTDPDDDAVAITITSVTQDEAPGEAGDGDTSPDGVLGGATALVRSERAGTGNGRVYRLGFTADDGQGGVCFGSVEVSVPHDKSGARAVDDGQFYDSTRP